MQKLKVAALLALGVYFTWETDLYAAATNVVKIRLVGTHYAFDPTNLVIFTGDIVKWTNSDISTIHDTTHNTNFVGGTRLWGSVELSNTVPNNTFSFTFNTNGSYPYYCFRHTQLLFVQTGLVSVVSGPMITQQSATLLPDGNFSLEVHGGTAGQRCIIDASDTLLNWSPIWTTNFPNTLCPTCPFIQFIDTAKLPNRRFYRARVFSN